MQLALLILGVGGLALVGVDVVATTAGSGTTGGGGPATARLARRLWALALRLHRRRPSHRALHVFGLGLMIGIVTAWIVTIWISWTLVFDSVEGSVVEATTGETADLWGKAYFAGYSILTLGNGELVPASTPWRLTTLAAAGTGLALVTLAVTYILNVVQASNRRRSLAAVIWTLGDTSADIVERAANDPDNFSSQVWSLVEPFTLVREQHVAFPVLHYLHATEPHRALPAQADKLARAVRCLRADPPVEAVSSSKMESIGRALAEYAAAVSAYSALASGPATDDGPSIENAAATAGWDDLERE